MIKDIFFPTGEILLTGDMEKLLHTISQADGVLKRKQEFQCALSFPKKMQSGFSIGSSRGINRVSFLFQCRYEETEAEYRIFYRVFPGCSSICLAGLPLLLLLCGLIQQMQVWLIWLSTGVATLVIYMYLMYARKKCIERFQKIFSDKSEAGKQRKI